MKLNILIIFILLFFSYKLQSDQFKNKRIEAIELLKEGKSQNDKRLILQGLRKMKYLSKIGDVESMFALGRIYLAGTTVDKNFGSSYEWFLKAGKSCHKKSLLVLDKFFLNKKSSKFFSPSEYRNIINNCAKINNKVTANNKEGRKEKNIEDEGWNTKKNQEPLQGWRINSFKVNIGKLQLTQAGSGFAINSKGYFLTNRHVVTDCSIATISYNNYTNYASIVMISNEMDAAILKTEAETPFYVSFDTDKYKVGEKLYAAGFPFIIEATTGDDLMSLSEGSITNTKLIETKTEKYMIVSVPMSSGNSGGPVINSYGLLRGMSAGGFNEELFKKEYGDIVIGGFDVNVMVPGNQLKKWLNYIGIRVDEKNRNIRMESEEIGEVAHKMVSKISCFKK